MEQLSTIFIEQQSSFRLGCFISLLFLFMGIELLWPRRKPENRLQRRISNLGLLAIDALAVRIFIPLATYQLAIYASTEHYGLFNLLSIPFMLNILLTIVLFDLLIYLQHVFFHKVRLFWRIHRVHHTDIEIDVTTGIRFHPLEIIISFAFKLGMVIVIGPAAFAIVLYEVLLNSAALFGHSNIKLPIKLDRMLRTVFVTPDMHRIHHSVIQQETDSNFGNLFSFWDKIFRTYRAQPEAGYEGMIIGLDRFRDQASNSINKLLMNPFLGDK